MRVQLPLIPMGCSPLRGFLYLSLESQPAHVLESYIWSTFVYVFLCSKFTNDHIYLVLLEIWLSIVLFKKYTHKCFG